MENLLSMVILDKQIGNYKLFARQEDIKRIMSDISYDLDDIVVWLNHVEKYMVLDSETESNDHKEKNTVITAPPLNNVPPLNISNTHSPPLSLVIILD